MTHDFLFAMMSTRSKPRWRHSNWNGTDYMICTVADPQKKLPTFKPGKWSLLPDSRISLCGHDAKCMKNFTLHFDMAKQCESPDRSWFGEMWFPVERYVYQVQYSVTYDSIPDPPDLDLEHGYSEPELCFSKSQVRDPAHALRDSGATHALLPEHMLPKGARSFEVTVHLADGKEKARCWRSEVYAEDRAHPLLPPGRLASLLDTKFIWENGEALMPCRDKGQWRTMTKFEIRSNMAYASQKQFEVLRRALWVQQAKPQTLFDWKFWERAAHDPKMTAYLNHGVKPKMCETTPFGNAVGAHYGASRAYIQQACDSLRSHGKSVTTCIGLSKGVVHQMTESNEPIVKSLLRVSITHGGLW